MRKVIIVTLFLLLTLTFTGFHPAYSIPVDFSGAMLINGPYPFSHDDSLGSPDAIDYYKFWAQGGDTLTADIDNGFDGRDGGVITPGEDIDIILTLFEITGAFIPYTTFGDNCKGVPSADDAGCGIDSGLYPANPFSLIPYTKDPFITYAIPVTGFYHLAVTVADNHYSPISGDFTDVSTPDEFPLGGTYALVIDGLHQVPEPSTILLFTFGLLGLLAIRGKQIIVCVRPLTFRSCHRQQSR